jgi:DHA2 family multidrug resistance protein
MAIISATGFACLITGQITARRPVIKLRLLLDRQFGSVAMMGVVLGIAIYGTTYAIPQFLSAVAGYDSLQAGKVVLLSGIPSLLMMAMVPILLRRIDVRVAVASALVILSTSAMLDAELTIHSDGNAFVASQLLRGVGQILGFLFLNQACVRSVPVSDAGDASGLFNAVRNLGGSLALAGISIIQDQRLWFHSRRLEETLHANSPVVQDYLASTSQTVGSEAAGLRVIAMQIQQQALVMTYNDIFWVMSVGILLVLPLVFFLRPLPRNAPPAAMH